MAWTMGATRNYPASGSGITHGSQLTPENVGLTSMGQVDAGPGFTGNLYMRQSFFDDNNGGSTVVEGLTLSACGFAFGSQTPLQVTFRNCVFTGSGQTNGGVWFNTSLAGDDTPPGFSLAIENCLFDGQDQVTDDIEEVVIQGGNFSMTSCEIKGLCGSTRNFGSDWSMTEVLVWKQASLSPAASPHSSAVGILQGSNISLTRCKFVTYDENGIEGDNIGATAAIDILARQQGNSNNIAVTDCAIGGGGNCFEAGGDGSFTLTNMNVSGLVVLRDAYQNGGRFGPVQFFDVDDPANPNTWDAVWGPLESHNVSGDPAAGTAIEAA